MNLKDCKPSEDWDVRVHGNTPVGNPYPMHHESERDEVCDQYQDYFDRSMNPKSKDDTTFKKYMGKLIEAYKIYGKLRLFCCCAPRRCHGESIKKYIIDRAEYDAERERLCEAEMTDWFGKGCTHFSGQWEGSEEVDGPDWQDQEPVLVHCGHPDNKSEFEGNCNNNQCPLNKEWQNKEEKCTIKSIGPK